MTNGVILTAAQQETLRAAAYAQTSALETSAKAQKALAQYDRVLRMAV